MLLMLAMLVVDLTDEATEIVLSLRRRKLLPVLSWR